MIEWICNIGSTWHSLEVESSALSLWQALGLFFGLGSLWVLLHCGAMCGPIICGLRFKSKEFFLYQIGRLSVYFIFGFLAGIIGEAFAWASLWTNLFLAIFFIVYAAALIFKPNGPLVTPPRQILEIFGRLIRKTHSSLIIGMIFSFLPCGITFWALGIAASTQNPWNGAIIMASLVGLSSIPLFAASYLGRKAFFRIPKIQAAVLLISAVSLIWR